MTKSPRAIVLHFCVSLTALTAAAAHAQTPAAQVDRFVPDVVGQFDSFSRRPDALAFDVGDSPFTSTCKHYQAIARKQAADGTNYLYVTKSGNLPGGVPFPNLVCDDIGQEDNQPGALLVVRMGSRDPHGERMRATMHYQTPIEDGVERTIRFDGGADFPAYRGSSGWPAYGHPGGMQIVGDVLAVALEAPYEGAPDAAVVFMDVSNAAIPRFLSVFAFDDAPTDDFGAGTLGVTALKNGRYLMLMTGKNNREVRFYLSASTESDGTTNLKAQNLDWQELRPSASHHGYKESDLEASTCLGIDWPSGGGFGHQTLNFVREGNLDGALYILGARNDFPGGLGDDRIDLFEVDSALYASSPSALPACPFRRVSTRHLYSYPFDLIEDWVNFAAGTGIYVSPSGELILYATNHDNSAGKGRDDGSSADREAAGVGEWRPIDMVRANSPTLQPQVRVDGPFSVDEGATVALTGGVGPALQQAWIELFNSPGAGLDVDEPWLAIDYPDRVTVDEEADNLYTYRGLGAFAESATSVRYFAPAGCDLGINAYPITSDEWPGPDSVQLTGTGDVHAIDLRDMSIFDGTFPVPAGETPETHNFNDDIEGVTFDLSCDDYYAQPIAMSWDTDRDGTFESAGTSVPLDASALDGPSTFTINARGVHPTDTTSLGTGVNSARVTVNNVAPTLTQFLVVDMIGQEIGVDVPFALLGAPVTTLADFTDAGRLDHQTAQLDWDDGTIDNQATLDQFSDAFGGVLGRLGDAHLYAQAGDYAVALEVSDDDGGVTSASAPIRVVSPIDAVVELIDLIDAAIAAASSDAERTALLNARKALAGSVSGQGNNGALDKLQRDQIVAAIVKLEQAIDALEDASAAGADVDLLLALLRALVAVLQATP